MFNVALKQIMTSPVETIRSDDSFSRVAEKFERKGIRHLPVVDHQDCLIGLVTQRDLYRVYSPRMTDDGYFYDPEQLNKFILARVMAHDPFFMGPDERLSEAIKIMAARKYGCIPIVDADRHVIGIITEIDVLKYLGRLL
ncbi:MAG: hypothetical protein A2Z83_08315 [Omnitrophica bacterium GWA2_52_8]|nr:MAG: hypothetical protein A2Z83_08315 [Omnitrophica bacterium GWA2_52_8]